MKINIFEGARRMVKVVIGLWMAGVTVIFWLDYGPGHDLWSDAREVARWAIGGATVIFGISLALGWIVRGFLGVPTGKDSRQP